MRSVAATKALRSDVVQWGSTDLDYSYQFRPSRRTLSITVHPDLRIVVSAPAGTPPEVIRSKVLKRAGWIYKKRREFARHHPLQPPRSYVAGETHRYLGRQYKLKLAPGESPSVKLARGLLLIISPDEPSPLIIRAMVDHWMQRRARAIFIERFEICHGEARRFRVPYPRVWIRPMNNRWGSCTPGGRIILNPELIKAPIDCIDYVITHELCHLVEPNHNARFWQLLGALMPDWKARRERLNEMADL